MRQSRGIKFVTFDVFQYQRSSQNIVETDPYLPPLANVR